MNQILSVLSAFAVKKKTIENNELRNHFLRKTKISIMYYILFYKTTYDYLERRGEYRAEHLGLARAAHARGEIALAGALADPADGAVLVFKGDSPEAAENFARNDPYVKNGLIVEWHVRSWTVVIGDE